MTDLARAGWHMVPITWCQTCRMQAAADHVCHLRELLHLATNTVHPADDGLDRIREKTSASAGDAAEADQKPHYLKGLRPMGHSTDRTLQILDEEITQAKRTMNDTAETIAGWRERLADAEEHHAETDAHLRTLTSLRAILSGQGQALTPGDIRSHEGVVGMVIGALAVCPPEDATAEELAAYVDTMRALNHQASHQAVIATGRVRELEAATDQLAEPISASHDSRHDAGIWQSATCKWCSARIFRNTLNRGEWGHPNNGSVRCHPVDGEQSPLAEPVDPAPNGPDVHPAAPVPSVPCDDCETTGYNCLAHGGRPDRRNYRSILDPAACPGCGRLHFPWCAPHGGPQAGPSQADWLVATGQQETREQPAVAPAGPDPLAPLPPNVVDGRTGQTRPDMPPAPWGPPMPSASRPDPFDIGPDPEPEPAEDEETAGDRKSLADDPGTGKTSAEATR